MTWYDKVIVNCGMYLICVYCKHEAPAHKWERRYFAWCRRRARAREEARAWARVRHWIATEQNRPR